MRGLLIAGSLLVLGLASLGCASPAENAEDTSAAETVLTPTTLFDGQMEARLPCEPEQVEAPEESTLRAATCQEGGFQVTALRWLGETSETAEPFDLERVSEAVLQSARSALEKQEATDLVSEATELEMDGLQAMRAKLEGVVDEQARTVESVVVAGEEGGWGLQLLYDSDNEAAAAKVEEIFDSFQVEQVPLEAE